MTATVPAALVAQLKVAVMQQLGWNYTAERSNDLMRGIEAAASELGRSSLEEFVRELLAGPFSATNLNLLSKHLTIGETYFWREPQSLNLFKERILPKLVATPRSAQRPLRIWSAGCSTGEEAYSLAILLCETLPKAEREHVSILATDINPVALQKARRGVYGPWSFRGTPDWLKSRYFHASAVNGYQLVPEVQNMVSFSALNLAAPVYPKPWGIPASIASIWCRNVLIYFDAEQTSHVLSRFYSVLETDGTLIVAPCETPRVGLSKFTRVRFPEMTFFQKGAISQGMSYGESSLLRREVAPTGRLASPALAAPGTGVPLRPAPQNAAAFSTPRIVPQPTTVTAVPHRAENNSVEVAIHAVRVAANAGHLEQALQLAQQALADHKLEPKLHYLNATILQELGRFDEAGAALRKTLFLDSDFVLAHFALADLARQRGQKAEADRHLTTTQNLLRRFAPDAVLPESDGLTAGQLIALLTNPPKGEAE